MQFLSVRWDPIKVTAQLNWTFKGNYTKVWFFFILQRIIHTPDPVAWLEFCKTSCCQYIAGVEIQPMSLTAPTNILNTFMHTLVSVNIPHLSRKKVLEFEYFITMSFRGSHLGAASKDSAVLTENTAHSSNCVWSGRMANPLGRTLKPTCSFN